MHGDTQLQTKVDKTHTQTKCQKKKKRKYNLKGKKGDNKEWI